MKGKTNAMRLLDSKEIKYEIITYEVDDGEINGVAVGKKINKPVDMVYKTLVARWDKSIYVFVIPVAEELDLKKAAKAAGEKKLEMVAVKDLLKETGYIRGGCSPIGMKKLYPTYIDDRAALLEKIIVSGGKIGFQIELSPSDLVGVVNATYVDLIK